jgi:hypothetical protein
MLSDWQKQVAKAVAADRQIRHTDCGSQDYQIDTRVDGSVSHTYGLYGEWELYNEFGGEQPDFGFREDGDGGMDSVLRLKSGKAIPVDVKVNTYLGPDQRIRVPIDKLHNGVIYIAGRFSNDNVELVGWIPAEDLVNRGQIMKFRGPLNFTMSYENLYPMAPLKIWAAGLERVNQ